MGAKFDKFLGRVRDGAVALADLVGAGTFGKLLLQQDTVLQARGLLTGSGWYVLPENATSTDWSVAVAAIASDGVIVAPNNHTINFAALTVPAGVTVIDTKLPGVLMSQTAMRTSATNNHILFQSTVPGATRIHVEPKDMFPAGTASKVDYMFGNYDDSPNSYAIASVYTENYSAGSTRTDKAPYAAMCNVKGVGDWWGVMPQMGFGFGDHDAANGVFASGYYFDTSDTAWRGPMVGPWRAGLTVASGVYAQAGGKLYQAAGAGTCGATKPTHSAGSVSDGGVSWTFVRDFVASSAAFRATLLIGGRDDKPLFNLPSYGCQIATDVAVWNAKSLRFMQNSTTMGWRMYQAAGTTDFYFEDVSGTSRLRFGGTASKFLSFNNLAFISSVVTYTDNNASPSVASGRTFVLTNTAATNVTSFTGGLPFQEIIVRAGNGNTTLVNGANLRLRGGANITLAANDLVMLQANTGGTVWTQV